MSALPRSLFKLLILATEVSNSYGSAGPEPDDTFFDFTERIDLRACNKRVFEALISSGALDGLGGHRAQYWSALDSAMQEASLKQQERDQAERRDDGARGQHDIHLSTQYV